MPHFDLEVVLVVVRPREKGGDELRKVRRDDGLGEGVREDEFEEA